MDSVSLATPASVAATEKKALNIQDMIELVNGGARAASEYDVAVDVKPDGSVHMRPIRGRKRNEKEKLRQAERSRKHKLKGVRGTGDEENTVIKCNGGGDEEGDIVLEICATSAASDAMASVAASEIAAAETAAARQQAANDEAAAGAAAAVDQTMAAVEAAAAAALELESASHHTYMRPEG